MARWAWKPRRFHSNSSSAGSAAEESDADELPLSPAATSPGASPSTSAASQALVCAANLVASRLMRDHLQVGKGAPEICSYSIFDWVGAAEREQLMQSALRDPRAVRAMGAMVGMAVADAVGAFLEFVPVGTKGSGFDPKSLKVAGKYNKFALKFGQWTDDTSMGLCLADSLLVCGGYDGTDVRVRFWNWWFRGYNNAFRRDASRSQSVGLGGNVAASLKAVKSSQPPARFDSGSEDAGNGSLMRLAPVPIFFHTDVELVIRASAESSLTTHPGATAAEACAFLGFLLVRALGDEARRRESAAQFLSRCADAYLQRPEAEGQTELRKLLRASEPFGSRERCWNWRDPAGPFLAETIAARGKSYNGYTVDPGYFGGYSLDGLALALHSVYHTRSFMEAITRCVNYLGDADSTGAICGQIAGAFYGLRAVDARLVEHLERWDAGETALRGALLYALGSQVSAETRARTYRLTEGALHGLPPWAGAEDGASAVRSTAGGGGPPPRASGGGGRGQGRSLGEDSLGPSPTAAAVAPKSAAANPKKAAAAGARRPPGAAGAAGAAAGSPRALPKRRCRPAPLVAGSPPEAAAAATGAAAAAGAALMAPEAGAEGGAESVAAVSGAGAGSIECDVLSPAALGGGYVTPALGKLRSISPLHLPDSSVLPTPPPSSNRNTPLLL